MVPLRTSIVGVAKYVRDDVKFHACTHQKRVIISRNKMDKNVVMVFCIVTNNID